MPPTATGGPDSDPISGIGFQAFLRDGAIMEMSGEIKIDASRARVWAGLNDPAVLKDSIPGCTALEKISDTEMTATVDTKVGMVPPK